MIATIDTPAAQLAADLAGFRTYLHAELGLALNSRLAYSRDLQHFARWAQGGGLADYLQAEPADLERFLTHCHEAGLAPATRARMLSTLRLFYAWLCREGRTRHNPAERLKGPALWQRLPVALCQADVEKLLAAPVPQDRYYLRDAALLAVLFATGARASEAAGLALADLRQEQGYCRCRGKGGKERILPLCGRAARALAAYLEGLRPALVRGRPDAATVFVSRGGRSLTRERIWMLVKQYARRAGLGPEVSPHVLRRSCATALVAGGMGLRDVQELLGHALPQTTQRYCQVDQARLRAVHQQYHPRGAAAEER